MKLIPLKYDFCIKEVMENETVRKHFISDVLGIALKDIKSVRIMNSFLWKRYKKQKLGILDIQLELNDDTKINIEIQLKQKYNWKKRSVFYLAKMFTAETEEELDMLKSGTKNLGMMEAIKELKEISLTDRLRYEHEMKLKAKRDRRAEDKYIYYQGQKDGIEKGRIEGRLESIKGTIIILRKNGLSDEQIVEELVKECGLSREEAFRML